LPSKVDPSQPPLRPYDKSKYLKRKENIDYVLKNHAYNKKRRFKGSFLIVEKVKNYNDLFKEAIRYISNSRDY